MYKILTINPGSTSTKIAIYEDEKEVLTTCFNYSREQLNKFNTIHDQFDFRTGMVMDYLEKEGVDLSTLSAVVGRGGLLPPIKTGGYVVNDLMVKYLRNRPVFHHASNLGAAMAKAIADPIGVTAYIYDGVTSDELSEVARITGFPEIKRRSYSHVLNSRTMARKAAEEIGKKYEDMNFIVAHLGGGMSITAHEHGRMVDSISDDGGPFSPERSGCVNLLYVVDMCYSGLYSKDDVMRKIRGLGGLAAHLGTHDCREIERRIENGDEHAKLIYEAQAYQLAKGIGMMLTVFDDDVDMLILTGGLAYSEMMTGMICKKMRNLVPVKIMPGENESESLALGVLRILRGEEEAHEFAV